MADEAAPALALPGPAGTPRPKVRPVRQILGAAAGVAYRRQLHATRYPSPVRFSTPAENAQERAHAATASVPAGSNGGGPAHCVPEGGR